MSKLAILFCSALFICFFGSFIALKNQHGQIPLHDEKFTFTPQKYYIVNVADARIDRNVVAILVEEGQKSLVKVDLKDGAVVGIKSFLDRNLHRDTTLRPVLLTIREFKLTETQAANGTVNGDLKIGFSFSYQQSYQNKRLDDFNKDIHYNRAMNKPADVEGKLRSGIVDGITYFNSWINHQSDY